MSGCSPELIDYLEGKIPFEEFEWRREERKTLEKKSLQEEGKALAEEHPGDAEVPSSSGIHSARCHLRDAGEGETSDGDKPPSRLPRALRGRMAEANIRFGQGKQEEAIQLCMDIIQQAPLAYEPFSTLAMIYEDQGDMEKSLRLAFIAAHLNPSDTEEWVRLAEMSLEQDNIKQAIFCYTQALKYEPTNIRFLWEQSNLCEQMDDHKMAMDGYRRILNLLPASDGQRFMQLVRDKAKGYQDASEDASAISMIEEAFSKSQTQGSMEGVGLTADENALQVTMELSKVVLDEDTSEDEAIPLEEKKGCGVIWMGACP